MAKKPKRKRILRGVLMASTNAIQQSCIDALFIIQYYKEGLPFTKVKRIVEHNPTANDIAGIPPYKLQQKTVR
jgi:hypothetical protein